MKRIFKYLKPYAFFAIISPLLMIGEVMADLMLPKMMTVIVDCGINSAGDVSASPLGSTVMRLLFGEGTYSPMQVIITFGILMLLCVLIGGAFGILCAYTAVRAAQSLGRDLRRDAYASVMSLSINQSDRFTTGSLVTRMTNDIGMIVDFTEMMLRMIVRSPMFFVGGIIMLATLDIGFGTVLLIFLPLMVLTLFLILRRAVPLFGIIQGKLDRVNSVVQENVVGARVVKAYVREDYEYTRFENANRDLRDNNMRVLRIMAVMHPVLVIVMNFATIAVIFIGGWRIENVAGSGMSAGTIMAAVSYITQILMSVMMVSMIFNSISRAMASLKRVNEVLDEKPEIISGSARSAGEGEYAVQFKNVGFAYSSTGRPVLRGIDLDIKRGETFAIIGSTGVGKTSLVNLIPRFYDPTQGEVLVDGVDVRLWDIDALRAKISYVMQKSELFSGSIGDNIRWGRSDADEDEISRAARVAQAEDFIMAAGGYDGYIAEKGASLSGGQKQRMSIARAIVRRPSILIFDDATSALDLATEAKLRAAFKSELKDTTVIMIAQRIASVRDADRIAVLDDGVIVDCGTHEELMQSCATYKEIYNSQIGLSQEEEMCNEQRAKA